MKNFKKVFPNSLGYCLWNSWEFLPQKKLVDLVAILLIFFLNFKVILKSDGLCEEVSSSGVCSPQLVHCLDSQFFNIQCSHSGICWRSSWVNRVFFYFESTVLNQDGIMRPIRILHRILTRSSLYRAITTIKPSGFQFQVRQFLEIQGVVFGDCVLWRGREDLNMI